MSYSEIKRLSEELNRPMKTLLALSHNNDPFNAGAPRRQRAAEWFAGLWRTFGFGSGTHIRRIHYRIISQPVPILMPDGESPYQNTEYCWQALREASRDARLLELVPIADFIDARNGASTINDSAEAEEASLYTVAETDDVTITPPELALDTPTILQPYHVEIVVEKTTMDDVLLPLGREYDVDVTSLGGEISLTRCRDIVLRARRADQQGRPTRILYVSDFDPAGMGMPVSAARKIEHLFRNGYPHLDIQLRPVVLTHEQCEEYELPRTPLKETELRAGAFEARYGEGATELDALEALHPGELHNILAVEIERYRDLDLDEKIEEAAASLNEEIEEVNQAAAERYADEIAALQASQAAVDQRRRALYQEINAFLREGAPDILVRWPDPTVEGDDDFDPLFDSTRDYVEQIDRFKAHQGRTTERIPPGRKRAA